MSAPTNSATSRTPLIGKGTRIDPFYYITLAAAISCIGLLLLIAVEVIWSAWPAIYQYGGALLLSKDWDQNEPSYGLLPFLFGSCVTASVALVLALPLGVFIAIFLVEDFIIHPLRQAVRFVVELLAAIPSVVYGLWGLTVIVPFSKWIAGFVLDHNLNSLWFLANPSPTGVSLFTASIVLSLMILPTITAISRNSLESVPHVLREGAYSLGATRWETIFGVLLPSAAPGIVASAILALGRALGETMAVALLIGGTTRFTISLLSPSSTLASLLAAKFGEVGDEMPVEILMYAAVVLMLMTVAVNLIGAWVLKRAQAKVKGLI